MISDRRTEARHEGERQVTLKDQAERKCSTGSRPNVRQGRFCRGAPAIPGQAWSQSVLRPFPPQMATGQCSDPPGLFRYRYRFRTITSAQRILFRASACLGWLVAYLPSTTKPKSVIVYPKD